MSKKMLFQGIILTLAFVGQIVTTVVVYTQAPFAWLQNVGWIILYASALFGWWPIFAFRRWGEVKKGKGYIHTQTLVVRGPYAIVRHPQYLSGILLAISMSLLSQKVLAIVLGAIAAGMTVAGIEQEDETNRTKFGAAYEEYAERVPELDPLTGLIRWLKRSRVQDA